MPLHHGAVSIDAWEDEVARSALETSVILDVVKLCYEREIA